MPVITTIYNGKEYISGSKELDDARDAARAERADAWEARNPGETYDRSKSMIENNVRLFGNPHDIGSGNNPWYGENGVQTVNADGERGTKNTIYDKDLYPDGWNPDRNEIPGIDPITKVPDRDVYIPPELETPDPSDPIDMPDFFKRSPENPEWTGAYIPGVPGNPIPGPEGDDFSPFGKPIGKLSDSKVFGGLPRSTGPFGISGGYYGGNPYTGQENPLMAAQAAALRGG